MKRTQEPVPAGEAGPAATTRAPGPAGMARTAGPEHAWPAAPARPAAPAWPTPSARPTPPAWPTPAARSPGASRPAEAAGPAWPTWPTGQVRIRQADRADHGALRDFLDGLSVRTRYLRFFGGALPTSPAMLRI